MNVTDVVNLSLLEDLVTFGLINELIQTVRQLNETVQAQATRIEKREGIVSCAEMDDSWCVQRDFFNSNNPRHKTTNISFSLPTAR